MQRITRNLVLGLVIASSICGIAQAQSDVQEVLRQLSSRVATSSNGDLCLGVRHRQLRVGAVIQNVESGSAADGYLEKDDVVLVVLYENNSQVQVKAIGRRSGFVSLKNAVRSADEPPFGLLVVRDGEVLFVEVELQPCSQGERVGLGDDPVESA